MWAEKLQAKGVTVNSMHPGWADTEGVQTQMSGEAPRSCARLAYRARLTDDVSPTEFYEERKTSFRSAEEGADTIVWLAVAERVKGETGRPLSLMIWYSGEPGLKE
jgi:NAD(P)-dependent dehydrogenase (short-subunit alcohol dehydrogenase family)